MTQLPVGIQGVQVNPCCAAVRSGTGPNMLTRAPCANVCHSQAPLSLGNYACTDYVSLSAEGRWRPGTMFAKDAT